MNVFRMELKLQLTSLLRWTLAILGLLALFMPMLPGFRDAADQFKEVLNAYPPEVISGFGISMDTIFNEDGFFAYVYGYAQLMLAIMGLLWGLNVFGRENINRMSDFIYTKPLSRSAIMVQKLAVCLVSVLVVTLSVLVLAEVVGRSLNISDPVLNNIRTIILSTALLHFFFIALGALLAVLLPRINNPLGIATGIGFGFYILLLVSRLVDDEKIGYLSPFYAVQPERIILDGLNGTSVAALAGFSLLLLVVAFIRQRSMDKGA